MNDSQGYDGFLDSSQDGAQVTGMGSHDLPPEPEQDAVMHPRAQFFHLVFKVAALAMYMLGNLLNEGFVSLFVLCVLLHSFDFWTVKNVTGRILVGLRWWNEVKEDGSNVWIYESKPSGRKVHPKDSSVFWWSTYLTPVVWLIIGLGAVISFRWVWLPLIIMGVVMTGSNAVGYWKCERDAKQKIASFIAQRL